MNDQQRPSLTQTRRLLAELRQSTAGAAPPSLLDRVRAALGPADAYAPLEAPIGPVYVAYNDQGIAFVLRADEPRAFERAFRQRFRRPLQAVDALPPALRAAVLARLHGDIATPLPLDLRALTPFERAVLLKALEIPPGEVRPYAWIAREIGHPHAVRAVGSALANNPVPLLIPCHRVVRSDGQIGNYIFGSAVKRAVLEREGAAPGVLERLGRAGVRFLGNPEAHTFCLPTCGGMHRRAERFMQLHSAQEALATGLRPCGQCRPLGSDDRRAVPKA